jgi:hypothetical protein
MAVAKHRDWNSPRRQFMLALNFTQARRHYHAMGVRNRIVRD